LRKLLNFTNVKIYISLQFVEESLRIFLVNANALQILKISLREKYCDFPKGQ